MHADLLRNLPVSIDCPAINRISELIQRAVSSQSRIINDLLDLSRIRTGKFTIESGAVDIGEVVSTLVKALDSDTTQRGAVIHITQTGTSICSGDRARIEQILGNLLRNAVRFTPASGHVYITMERDGMFCKISVADTGCGISEDFLPHVFGMFSQASDPARRSNGLGIGLALVHELTLAHGGRVEVHSKGLGQGAEFDVWLPMSILQVPLWQTPVEREPANSFHPIELNT